MFKRQKLAWLAFAGNPFCKAPPPPLSSQLVHWQDLQIAEQLGEGASGLIYKASWQIEEATQDVALKLFKGALTSDGLPQCEMAACLAAGEHPALIGAIGEVKHHPEQTPALLMPLIASGFSNLAGPPSLESCTRDIYQQDQPFSLDITLRILSSIAAAAAHLHAAQILHGDLYAHNILINTKGETLLGDFGAASFYTDTRLQKIEVKAFAYLLEELISRTEGSPALLNQLLHLQARCSQSDLDSRPIFTEIFQELSTLSNN